ncbi:MAG TPA: efflux RND transporter periplasmic adaptor subunit [Methylotenera sp.]|nr:efflux RND transporter periplasmic adaptor subunit [Methylotenera sp.]
MQFKNKQSLAIIAVVVIGIILGAFILGSDKSKNDHDEHAEHVESNGEAIPVVADEHEHNPQAEEIAKGPHGGKLFTKDGYGLEVTIFEKNVPPEFRLFTYQDGKPLDPATSNINIQLERLGSSAQAIGFVKENDYLKGDAVIEEPHSFKVTINAKHNGKSYQFAYEQVEARVKVTDKQLTLNSIEVLTAGPAKIKSILLLQGEIKLNADKSVHIVPRVGGIVESVTVNAGDKVRKGQVLASISSQAIADLRSDLLAAQKRVGLARSTYNREKQLWEEKISAEQDYLQAQHDLQEAQINADRAQQKLGALGAGSGGKGQARYEIRSPIDGVVTDKKVSQGQVVSEADSIFEVADLSTVWAEMTIYAKDINTVKIGQKVTIKATAFDAEAVGTISYVGALVGEQTRTAMARVVLSNPKNTWLPGLPVNIELISDEIDVPLAVSVEGLQTLRDWTVVFGRYGEYFEARPLELGRRDDKYVEVLKGLSAGDKYAAGNSFLIKADIGKAGASHDH